MGNKANLVKVLEVFWSEFLDTSRSNEDRKNSLTSINNAIDTFLGFSHPVVFKHYQILGKKNTDWKAELASNFDKIKEAILLK